MYASDRGYDGRFYIGVLTTGIYCMPSCGARKPKAENVVFLPSREAAIAQGLRACKRCRPDSLIPLQDQEQQAVVKLASAVADNPCSYLSVDDLGKELGCRGTKLNSLFQTYYHMPPGEWLLQRRLAWGAAQVRQGMPVTEIAFDLGYENPSSFSEAFREAYLLSPSEYAKLGSKFNLAYPSPFHKASFLRSLTRDPGSETIKRDGLKFVMGCAAGYAEFEVSHVGLYVNILEGEPHDWLTIFRRMMGAMSNPRVFETVMAGKGQPLSRFVPKRSGLRVYLTADIWEAIVWAIVGQQINLPFACTLRSNLARMFGDHLAERNVYRIPSPAQIAKLSHYDLLSARLSTQKATYLLEAAKWACENDLLELAQQPYPVVEGELMRLKGIGVWTANYILMRGFGFRDCVPIGDTGVTSALQKVHELKVRPDAEVTRKLMSSLAPYRSLATFHLWNL